VRCPACGAKEIKRVERSAESKNRRKWLYLCLEKTCHNQFTHMLARSSTTPMLSLIFWLQAITLMLNAKKGISAKQLQRDLGIGGYKTAWYLNHRIREAMAEGLIPKLGGIVEIDDTYIGGERGRGFTTAKSRSSPLSDCASAKAHCASYIERRKSGHTPRDYRRTRRGRMSSFT
jgi:hypothetical protein